MGFFVMDYYIPSILIVVISWVSFWLHMDASPPRIVLGTNTILAFMTLASKVENSLPKVSYIKASEIWFLGCTIFLFAAMVEFAFVNTIYRRKYANYNELFVELPPNYISISMVIYSASFLEQ